MDVCIVHNTWEKLKINKRFVKLTLCNGRLLILSWTFMTSSCIESNIPIVEQIKPPTQRKMHQHIERVSKRNGEEDRG